MSIQGKQNKAAANTYEFDYMRKPDPRTGWEKFRDGIYDPSKGTVLGHTKDKWGVTLIFYLLFYTVLVILFAICMKGLLATLYKDRPKWILEESLIGTNPGLGFRPISIREDERSLVWYNALNSTEVKTWTDRLDKFLDFYQNSSKLPNGGRNQDTCSFTKPPQPGKVCAVDIDSWGPCSSQKGYGFNHSTPCIFIKLNKIYGWVPEYYNDTSNLPIEMPEDLIEHIKLQNASSRNTVWVSCKPENPHDKENIGPLEYYPKIQGFPGYFYPYENVPGYLSPIVAVHFKRPASNVIINVECRAWAKNIFYGSYRNEKKGAVHFELLVDGN